MTGIDRVQSTQQAYDRVAEDFAIRTSARSEMAASFFDRFVAELRPGGLVADLGCGPGHDLARLRQHGLRAIGLDRSLGLLAIARAQRNLTIQGDLRHLPLGNEALDGTWCSAALLHIDKSDLAATFAEWKRVLRPGGMVGIATSLGGDEGWELVPAAPDRVPEISEEDQRWFVHHDESSVFAALTGVGFAVTWSAIRSSHRDWLQIIASAEDR